MKKALDKFLYYLRYERNASPHTIIDYRGDIEIFRKFLSWLYDRKLQKTTVARKLAALRTFFKFCVREGITKQNPARLVSTPKLPKRVPRVQTAEELNNFLDSLAGGPGGVKYAERAKHQTNQDA